MSVRFFFDTNVFVYAWDSTDPVKRQKALHLIRLAAEERRGVISYQVIQEFLNAALRKAARKITVEDAQQLIMTVFRPLLAVHSSTELFSQALFLQDRYRLSWYDSLIVAAAEQAKCDTLYTEDLQNGQRFGDLTVTNPFL